MSPSVSEGTAEFQDRLRQALGHVLFDAGERLVAGGHVRELRVLQAGKVVTGVIAADEPRRVYVQYDAATKPVGECGCGAGESTDHGLCVHVAAVCIAAARQGNAASVPAGRAARMPSSQQGGDRVPAQRLYYCLARSRMEDADSAECNTLYLSLWVATPGAEPGTVQPQSATEFVPHAFRTEGRFPRYVDAEDELLLRALEHEHTQGGYPLRREALALAKPMIDTGRAHFGSLQARALRWAEPRRPQLYWQLQGDGTQRLTCAVPGKLALVPHLSGGLYIDLETLLVGALEPAGELEHWRSLWARDIVPEEVAALNQRLVGSPWLPSLRAIAVRTVSVHSVRGHLRLIMQDGRNAGPAYQLRFLYNDLLVEHAHPYVERVRVMAGDVVHDMQRDAAAEEALRARLQRASAEHDGPEQRASWLSFVLHAVPALRAEGWEVVFDPHFPYRIAENARWSTELTARGYESEGWFDLQLGVRIDEETCNLLPALVEYLQARALRAGSTGDTAAEHMQLGDTLLLRLADGRFVPVPMARIERIAQTLVELFDRDALNARGAVSLPRTQVSRLLSLEDDPAQLRAPDPALQRLLEELQRARIEPLPGPAGFAATLRPYQQEGLGWLHFLRRCQLGGILADDMGLGKTLQTLAHLLGEKQRRASAGAAAKPSLIVAPVSVIGNWQQELRRFAPELELVVLHGKRRRESFAAVAGCDVALTGYPQLLLDEEFLCSCDFALVVLDEAQMIKNPRTRAAQVARALRAEQRLCLTGTPLENHLGELWSLMDFAQPGLLGTERQFQRWYRTPIEKDRNRERAVALSRRIAPYLLRRTKDAVATELPEKTQIIETLVLEEAQRDFYDAIRLTMHARVQEVIEQQGLARSHLTILDALLKLRQACCDPRLVDLELGPDVAARDKIPSAKLQWLTTVLPQLAEAGRRVLLFSQFTAMLSLIEAAVREAGIDYCLLTGSTGDRTAQVARFQAGSVPLFLISLKAGGTGLNLTAADTVIHYDPWWNPAVEAQATDRAHRIGQRQPVFVYKLIAQGTVEEKILQLQARKAALASALYAEQTPLAQLSSAELVELLAS